MLNNEFRFVGVVVEDFNEVGTDNFSKKKFVIEVDKKGNRGVSQYPIVVYGTNKSIKTNVSIIGKLVLVNGYVDAYKGFISLVAQEMFEMCEIDDLENSPNNASNVVVEEKLPMVDEIVCDEDENSEITDDDMPF